MSLLIRYLNVIIAISKNVSHLKGFSGDTSMLQLTLSYLKIKINPIDIIKLVHKIERNLNKFLLESD
jgi:hypothetical protein